MATRFTRGRVLIFLAAVVVVVAVVGVLVARNGDDQKKCVSATFDSAPDTAQSAQDTFSIFIAEQEESPLPLTGWAPTSDTPDRTAFTSDVAGHWEVVISHGAVRSYSGCSR